MPVSVTIDPERRLTITIGEGVVTDEEFLRAREQLLANPAFDPDFDRIWDFHAVTDSQVSDAVATRLIATSPNSEKPICRAVVVSERATPMTAILDFINRIRQTNRRIAAFPDRDRAEKWIATRPGRVPAGVTLATLNYQLTTLNFVALSPLPITGHSSHATGRRLSTP